MIKLLRPATRTPLSLFLEKNDASLFGEIYPSYRFSGSESADSRHSFSERLSRAALASVSQPAFSKRYRANFTSMRVFPWEVEPPEIWIANTGKLSCTFSTIGDEPIIVIDTMLLDFVTCVVIFLAASTKDNNSKVIIGNQDGPIQFNLGSWHPTEKYLEICNSLLPALRSYSQGDNTTIPIIVENLQKMRGSIPDPFYLSGLVINLVLHEFSHFLVDHLAQDENIRPWDLGFLMNEDAEPSNRIDYLREHWADAISIALSHCLLEYLGSRNYASEANDESDPTIQTDLYEALYYSRGSLIAFFLALVQTETAGLSPKHPDPIARVNFIMEHMESSYYGDLFSDDEFTERCLMGHRLMSSFG